MRYLKLVFPFLLLLVIGLTLAIRRDKKKVYRQLLTALSLLFLLCWLPTSWLVTGLLEWQYLRVSDPPPDAAAIVVLSGGAWPPGPRQPYVVPLQATLIRCRHAAWLYNNWKRVPVVASAGHFSDPRVRTDPGQSMMRLLSAWGVPESDLWPEIEGSSTYEQAVEVSRILRQKGITKAVVVTEAYHMVRAEGCFRKLGIDVVAAPCGFRATPQEFKISYLLPNYLAILQNEEAIRELAALAWYRLRGRI